MTDTLVITTWEACEAFVAAADDELRCTCGWLAEDHADATDLPLAS